MNTIRHLRSILAPAIAAARAALRTLDDKEVPARLRMVAKRGDGTLPLPMTRTLLQRIAEDEWFRGKAFDAFDRRGSDDALSRAYLEQEPGWWISVSEAVARAEANEIAGRVAHLERELDANRARAAADRAKVKTARRDVNSAEKAARATIDDRLEPLRSAAASARAERDRAEADLAAIREDAAAVTAERIEAEEAAAVLSEELRAARRTAAQIRRSADAGPSESLPREPIDVARWLDRASASLAPFRDAVSDAIPADHAPEAGRVLVPSGVRPDSVAAIDALAGVDGITVLIDGHNVLGVLDSSTMATGRARRGLVANLGRLTRHLGDSAIEIVFDSDLEEGRPSTVSATGIVVRFAQGDLIADDVIVERAGHLRQAAVVVSDDREVRERCTGYGATVLWSQALVAWL